LAAVGPALIVLLAAAGSAWEAVVYRLLIDGGLVLAWLAAGWGFGNTLLLRMPAARTRVVTSIALGLGFLGLLVLGLGLAGILRPIVAWILIGVGVISLIITTRGHWTHFGESLKAPAGAAWLWVLVVPCLVIALFAALVPAGILWGDEPHGYDVVEYHLQVPREWYELGRIVPLKHNVFSFFPFNVEMHYLLAMELRGGPWAGQFAAQLMHVAFCALACAAVWEMTRSHVAGVLCAAVPWMTMLAPAAYNEGGMLLFAALAIGWSLEAIRVGDWKHFALAGAFAGLACGVKLTAAPVLLCGIPIAVLIVTPKQWMRGGVFFVAGLLTFSPWLVRNAVWAGNPVFPEAQRFLGRAHFTEEQTARWERAHSPTDEQRPFGARLRAAREQLAKDFRFGFVLIPMGLAAIALSFKRRETVMLACLLLILLVFWLFFTHLQGRFFVTAIPLIAFLITQVEGKWWRCATIAAAVAMAVVTSVYLTRRLIGFDTRLRAAGGEGITQLLGVEVLDRSVQLNLHDLPPSMKIALVGDAAAFNYQLPISRLKYRTVFDVDASARSIVDAWLGGSTAAETVIVIDPQELARFAETYRGIPRLPEDVPGPRDRPFILPAEARR
jgi:hypothetical protein